MKKLLLGVLFFISQQVYAQSNTSITIHGVILDSVSQKPISQVTVRLLEVLSGNNVKSTVSIDNGSFQLPAALDFKTAAQLEFSIVGYRNKIIPVKFHQKGISLGAVFLSAEVNQLKNVSVTANRQLVKQEIDRLSYDVQADPQAKSETAIEMLRRVPMISVDAEDNIQLLGSGSFRIFINGKPSALVTNNPKEVLRGMPANTIQKVEVITTPPAKYDAEGLAGIINIITVRKTADGYNGTVGARFVPPYGQGGNFSGAIKQNKIGLSLNGSYISRPPSSYRQVDFRKTYGVTPQTLLQDVNYISDNDFGFGGTELSVEFDSLRLLTTSLNYSNTHSNIEYDRSSVLNIPNGTVLQSYNSVTNGRLHNRNIDLAANYQLGFRHKKDQLLTLSYKYSNSLNERYSYIKNKDRFQFDQPDINQQNEVGFKEHTVQLDYVQPVNKITIEAGTKVILRNNFSNSAGQVFASQAVGYTDDPTQRNEFVYRQSIYSLYNSYTIKLPKWTLQGGLRAEYTSVDADFRSTATTVDRSYLNIVPSFSVLKTLPNRNSIVFGVTNRLMRPGINLLNPFVDQTNPFLIKTGNTELKPVISHLFELGYNVVGKTSLSTKLTYYYINNSIESVVKVVDDSLSLTSYDNVGYAKMVRLNVNGNIPLTPKWGVNFNSLLFYVWVKGTYNGREYSNEGPRTITFVNTSYKLNNTWQLGLSGGYNRRYINLQGGSNDYVYYSATGVCTIKNFTITGVLYNFLDPNYNFTMFSDTPDIYQSNASDLIYRYASIAITYRFGKLKSSIKKNRRSINNDDAVAVSN